MNMPTCLDIGHTYISKGGREWFIGSYRHAMPWPKDNVYRAVRMRLGLPRRQMCLRTGLSRGQWEYRERVKRMYHVAELLWLHEVSGLSWEEYRELLNDCA